MYQIRDNMIPVYKYQKYMKNINTQIGTQLVEESPFSSAKRNASTLKWMKWIGQ